MLYQKKRKLLLSSEKSKKDDWSIGLLPRTLLTIFRKCSRYKSTSNNLPGSLINHSGWQNPLVPVDHAEPEFRYEHTRIFLPVVIQYGDNPTSVTLCTTYENKHAQK